MRIAKQIPEVKYCFLPMKLDVLGNIKMASAKQHESTLNNIVE